MHRAQGKQKKIKQGGHNPLCPYKIIKTVSNNVIVIEGSAAISSKN
jgi:hypothetical protein